jgi:hypothetical protein
MSLTLECAGTPLPSARDQIHRYCGLPWSGGQPETWAYEYFDSVPTGPGDLVGPPDLLASAALHPGFGRSEMTWFNQDGAKWCEEWLSGLPRDVDLADAGEETIARLLELPRISEGIGLSVLSKVTHHKRPRLIPLFDRAAVDRYRRITGVRGEAAWSPLVCAMRADLAMDGNRRFLADVRDELVQELTGPVPSDLRLMDIAIWMTR